ncbi:MAG: hypothetical protein P8Z42_15475 [Anaerolineales bacterium]
MFLKNSRYASVRQVSVTLSKKRQVTAIALRRLPETSGTSRVVKADDRLDFYAQRTYRDATRFWHVADANTELEANTLVATIGRVIEVPEQ